ncbi:MAG: hypothetical protein JSV52_09850 [Candidatus Zixiibacteriota bacterium]|nr:MAG: hypothetical protein JSV52_09850 [candidate division Zixibacteria bacterium]
MLVLRYNFRYEETDNPNTTGRGHMNLYVPVDAADTALYLDTAGHFIDPPPHDSLYFDAHMRALKIYWEIVSDGKITLTWDIYPSTPDSLYELPEEMGYYGKCDPAQVLDGIVDLFIDAVKLADTASPEILFSDYESIFIMHAGSGRQSDIGFPPTCGDIFTGFIRFGDSVGVDHDSNYVRSALVAPETDNQDNRPMALNATLAHEFGHQLGLADLYSTYSFMSMLGDFALMDNNGFGTGIDFGFSAGTVLGAIPVYPMCWSRAYLGFVDVVDYRQGSDIPIVAAEMISERIKVARIPITENEYYLIENRIIDLDGEPVAAKADSARSVILGPTDTAGAYFNREYDFLMPGSGMLIFHVDERVAALDYNYDGYDNFHDNHLQWPFDIYGNPVDRFITLVEADGIVNFGGVYRSGYGSEDDMFRDDRGDAFTPNTNPPAIDNSGNNTHIYITDITRASETVGDNTVMRDTLMFFDVETDRLVEDFPVRAGYPALGISPVADDLDGDGNPEIIIASDTLLSVVTPDGQNFLRQFTGCESCPIYLDTAFATVNYGQPDTVPAFAITPNTITAGPVAGEFAPGAEGKLVVVGYSAENGSGGVQLYELRDDDEDGLADLAHGVDTSYFLTDGKPIAAAFGDWLAIVTDSGRIYVKKSYSDLTEFRRIEEPYVYGMCQPGDSIPVILTGEGQFSYLRYNTETTADRLYISELYTLGPAAMDYDADGDWEIVVCRPDGGILLVELDLTAPAYTTLAQRDMKFEFTTRPVVGDVDMDGQPDIIIGGRNAVYAFNHELTLKTSFPIEVNDRFPNDPLTAAPIVADIEATGPPEIVFPTLTGNIYSFGLEPSYGFPLSAGEMASGSPVYLVDTVGGKLGYLGADGWFYLWHVDEDDDAVFWPMFGGDVGATFAFDSGKLPALKEYAALLPERSFYNYPNPVVDGATTIRYFLAQDAVSVTLDIYDLSGRQVGSLSGPTSGRVDNELVWECEGVTPGVYRCVINADFGGTIETAFTDIAIIR